MDAKQNNEVKDEDPQYRFPFSRRGILKTAGAVSVIGGLTGHTAADDSSGTTSEEFDLIETTVDDLQEAFTNGTVTIQEVVQGYLDRIEAYDDELSAVITLNPDAIQRAEELDKEFRESGSTGPLHGVPILIKDNTNTRDMPTTGGSVLFEDTIPPEDAFLIQQLRNAGGIILAKVNLGEFSYGSLSSLGGETRSPYNTDLPSGGSSAGSAAGTAANLGAISIGTDTGGSIRGPASNNALVGLRPTTGLVSRDGIIPLTSTLDTAGPMTRTVADTAAMLDVLVGYDPTDPKTAESVGNIPDDSYTSYLNSDGLDGARIGVIQQLIDSDDDNETATVFESALSSLEECGATLVDIEDLPELSEIANRGDVIAYEVEQEFNEYLEELGDDAPVDSFAEIVESGTVEGVIADITFPELDEIDTETLDENADYLNALLARRELHQLLYPALADNELDAFVYPPGNYWISPVAAFPSIMVPGGFSEENLGVGIEFMARPFEEPLLIELAYAFEQATMYREPPDGFGSIE